MDGCKVVGLQLCVALSIILVKHMFVFLFFFQKPYQYFVVSPNKIAIEACGIVFRFFISASLRAWSILWLVEESDYLFAVSHFKIQFSTQERWRDIDYVTFLGDWVNENSTGIRILCPPPPRNKLKIWTCALLNFVHGRRPNSWS